MTNEEHQTIIDFKSCFSTEHGIKVLKKLSDYCYENRNTYVEGNHDKQNVNNGKRAVILYIKSYLETNINESKQEKALNTEVI